MIFDGDREYVGYYLRHLANEVGLRDWWIDWGHSTPQDCGHDDDVLGTCDPGYGSKRAVIRLRQDWPDWTEADFRHVCVHELLHSQFAVIRQPLHELEPTIGKLMFDPIWSATTNALEYCLDGIAYDWGRHLPLPSEWLEFETAPEDAA